MRRSWTRFAFGLVLGAVVIAVMTVVGWQLGEPEDLDGPLDVPSLPGLTTHSRPARIALAEPVTDPPAPVLEEDASEEEVPMEPVQAGEDGVEPPRFLRGAEPVLTEMAVRAGVEGTVIIGAVIDREGRVARTRVLKPLPFGLDKNALDAVATWRFRPAMRGGRPVACYWTLTVVFHLPHR